jgi:hypothetical protein
MMAAADYELVELAERLDVQLQMINMMIVTCGILLDQIANLETELADVRLRLQSLERGEA